MWEDPIVAEVHRTREMLAAKFNFDIDAIFADMQKRQSALGDRLVSPKTRAEPQIWPRSVNGDTADRDRFS
jgi:hypothetical protein